MHPRTRELIDHLDARHAELHAAVRDVPASHREQRPSSDRWSVAEILEHLAVMESRLAKRLGFLLVDARANDVGPEEDTSPVIVEHEQRMVLDRSRRLVAPDFVQPTGTMDADTALAAFDESRERLRNVVLDGDGLALGASTLPHPVFGALGWYQWLALIGGHEARHTAQIREVADALAA